MIRLWERSRKTKNGIITTEGPSKATASRWSLGIKGQDMDCGQRIHKRTFGPSSIPVSDTTTPFTGILGRINPFTQTKLCIKHMCNGRMGLPIKMSQYPLSAEKKILLLYLQRYQSTASNNNRAHHRNNLIQLKFRRKNGGLILVY
jgi:hypothetical protein